MHISHQARMRMLNVSIDGRVQARVGLPLEESDRWPVAKRQQRPARPRTSPTMVLSLIMLL